VPDPRDRRPCAGAPAGRADHRRDGDVGARPLERRPWLPGAEREAKCFHEFIRQSGLFDGVVDFDRAILDSATGELRPEFVAESTTGQPADKLHPNRAGYLAMGMSTDLDLVMADHTPRAGR
jgi:hypothetical protein